MSRPIIEFDEMEGFFLLVDSWPFFEAAFLGTTFLASNPSVIKAFSVSVICDSAQLIEGLCICLLLSCFSPFFDGELRIHLRKIDGN